MLTKIGFALAVLALVVASWTYRTALANALAPMPTSKQMACAQANCIGSISRCHSEYVVDWHESLYTAAKAPAFQPPPCRVRTDLALGD